MIDQATYCRVLLRGDLADAPGSLAAFRLSSTQWSVALAREQARSAAEMHRQIAELAARPAEPARRPSRQRHGHGCAPSSGGSSTSTWAAGCSLAERSA